MQNDVTIERISKALGVIVDEIQKHKGLDSAHQTVPSKILLLDVIADKLYVAFETGTITHHDILSKPVIEGIAPVLEILSQLHTDDDEMVTDKSVACAAKLKDIITLASAEIKSDKYSLINVERFCAEFVYDHYSVIFDMLDCSTALERPMSDQMVSSVFFYFSNEFRRYLKVLTRYIVMEYRNYLTKEAYAGLTSEITKEEAYEAFSRNKANIVGVVEKELGTYDQLCHNDIAKREPLFNLVKKKQKKKGLAGKLFGKEVVSKKKVPIKAELVPTSSPNFRKIAHQNTLLAQKLEYVYNGEIFNYTNIASHFDTLIGDKDAFDDTLRKFHDIIIQNDSDDLHGKIARQYAVMDSQLKSPILQEFILLALFYSTITFNIYDLQQYCASIEYKAEFLVEVISDLAENMPKHIAYMYMEKASVNIVKKALNEYADIMTSLNADVFEQSIQAGLKHLDQLKKYNDWIGTFRNIYADIRESRNGKLSEGEYAIQQLRASMDTKIDELCKFMK